jgi:hypothetical protein
LRRLTGQEIDAYLDHFIAKYVHLVNPIAGEAKQIALERVRRFLSQVDTDEVRSAQDFADGVIEEIKIAYEGNFATPRAETVIKRATKEIYEFYRLRDTSVFGDASKIPRLKFGAADTRAVRFFNGVDHWYLSGMVDNRRPALEKFLKDEYVEKGRALFGRGASGEMLDDFRRAAGGKLDSLNDHGVKTIINSSVQRIRSYANINQLRQGRYKWGRIVPTMDERTSPICIYFGEPPPKYIRVGVAASTIDRLTKLAPGDYALELYKSEQGKAYSVNPLEYVKDRIGTNGVIEDSLVAEGRGFPPYHPNCRTRVEGVETAVGDEGPSE